MSDKGEGDQVYCDVCDVYLKNAQLFNNHTRSMIHNQKQIEKEQAKDSTLYKTEDILPNPDADKRRDEAIQSYLEVMRGSQDAHSARVQDTFQSNIDHYCQICRLVCTGEKSLQSHLAGAKHRKNLVRLNITSPKTNTEIKKNPLDISSQTSGIVPKQFMAVSQSKQTLKFASNPGQGILNDLNEEIRDYNEPLVGLEHIKVYIETNSTVCLWCTCELCKSKFNTNALISHASGLRHRRRYLRYHFFEMWKELDRCHDLRLQRNKANQFVAATERKCGRMPLNLVKGPVKEIEADLFEETKQTADELTVDEEDYLSRLGMPTANDNQKHRIRQLISELGNVDNPQMDQVRLAKEISMILTGPLEHINRKSQVAVEQNRTPAGSDRPIKMQTTLKSAKKVTNRPLFDLTQGLYTDFEERPTDQAFRSEPSLVTHPGNVLEVPRFSSNTDLPPEKQSHGALNRQQELSSKFQLLDYNHMRIPEPQSVLLHQQSVTKPDLTSSLIRPRPTAAARPSQDELKEMIQRERNEMMNKVLESAVAEINLRPGYEETWAHDVIEQLKSMPGGDKLTQELLRHLKEKTVPALSTSEALPRPVDSAFVSVVSQQPIDRRLARLERAQKELSSVTKRDHGHRRNVETIVTEEAQTQPQPVLAVEEEPTRIKPISFKVADRAKMEQERKEEMQNRLKFDEKQYNRIMMLTTQPKSSSVSTDVPEELTALMEEYRQLLANDNDLGRAEMSRAHLSSMGHDNAIASSNQNVFNPNIHRDRDGRFFTVSQQPLPSEIYSIPGGDFGAEHATRRGLLETPNSQDVLKSHTVKPGVDFATEHTTRRSLLETPNSQDLLRSHTVTNTNQNLDRPVAASMPSFFNKDGSPERFSKPPLLDLTDSSGFAQSNNRFPFKASVRDEPIVKECSEDQGWKGSEIQIATGRPALLATPGTDKVSQYVERDSSQIVHMPQRRGLLDHELSQAKLSPPGNTDSLMHEMTRFDGYSISEPDFSQPNAPMENSRSNTITSPASSFPQGVDFNLVRSAVELTIDKDGKHSNASRNVKDVCTSAQSICSIKDKALEEAASVLERLQAMKQGAQNKPALLPDPVNELLPLSKDTDAETTPLVAKKTLLPLPHVDAPPVVEKKPLLPSPKEESGLLPVPVGGSVQPSLRPPQSALYPRQRNILSQYAHPHIPIANPPLFIRPPAPPLLRPPPNAQSGLTSAIFQEYQKAKDKKSTTSVSSPPPATSVSSLPEQQKTNTVMASSTYKEYLSNMLTKSAGGSDQMPAENTPKSQVGVKRKLEERSVADASSTKPSANPNDIIGKLQDSMDSLRQPFSPVVKKQITDVGKAAPLEPSASISVGRSQPLPEVPFASQSFGSRDQGDRDFSFQEEKGPFRPSGSQDTRDRQTIGLQSFNESVGRLRDSSIPSRHTFNRDAIRGDRSLVMNSQKSDFIPAPISQRSAPSHASNVHGDTDARRPRGHQYSQSLPPSGLNSEPQNDTFSPGCRTVVTASGRTLRIQRRNR